jgi:hypothetical protein
MKDDEAFTGSTSITVTEKEQSGSKLTNDSSNAMSNLGVL